MKAIDGRTTVYVCKNFSCQQPATTVAELEQQLQGAFSS